MSKFVVNVSKVSWLSLAISAAIGLSACGGSTSSSSGADFGSGSGGSGNPGGTFNEAALVENITDNVISPTYQAFRDAAVDQKAKITAYCDEEQSVLAGNTSDALVQAKTAAQQSWSSTMALWQQVEVMQLAVLTANASERRNKIYSWPVVNSCSVDQDVVYFEQGNINGNTYNIANRTNSRRGLDALEYLLFNTNLDHTCSNDSGIVANWNARLEKDKLVARCQFAVEVSDDVINTTDAFLAAWNGDTGYAQQLKTAGQPGSQIDAVHSAVNRISDAIFYIDSITKDQKLAKPLGIFTNDCGNGACPESLESQFSKQSKEHIINNLVGLQKLYLGNGTDTSNTLGFDDYLVDVGDAETAQVLTNTISEALTQLQSTQGTLANQLMNNAADVEQHHTNIKDVTDKLKTDFIVSLSLQLPATSAGDND